MEERKKNSEYLGTVTEVHRSEPEPDNHIATCTRGENQSVVSPGVFHSRKRAVTESRWDP
jgi:hypothetical protein